VDAAQLKLIWLALVALAASPAGALGGMISAATGSKTLVLAFSPLLSVAVRMISYEYVPIAPWS